MMLLALSFSLTLSGSLAPQGAAALSAVPILPPQLGAACQPNWLPTFGPAPGLDIAASASTLFDDGSGAGPALILGGNFTSAGATAAQHVVRWDGQSWSAIGKGLDGTVTALAVYDDGSGAGPTLYAAGMFLTSGGVALNRIARWDGTSWTALGAGLNERASALAVYDDGSGNGPELYVGGRFTSAGGQAALRIAKWHGSVWSPVGGGISAPFTLPEVYALHVFDDGSGAGPTLFVGGFFGSAGGVASEHIARWDGNTWSSVGGDAGHRVTCLASFDDGSGAGPALYAGGAFITIGGVTANRIARWDGSVWSPVGSGANDSVECLAVHDEGLGQGPALFAGGTFSQIGGGGAARVARWDGSGWSALGSGTGSSGVFTLIHTDGLGSGVPTLIVGGAFTRAGGNTALGVARWAAGAWSSIGDGLEGAVTSTLAIEDGSGAGLLVGGDFALSGLDAPTSWLARWNGLTWTQLGGVLNGSVHAMTLYDQGAGAQLYAAGSFTQIGGAALTRIARWDGNSWSSVGGGLDGPARAVAVYDAGSGIGPELFVGGVFLTAGGVNVFQIGRWNGQAWSSIGGTNGVVYALAVHDEGGGSGPALFVGGNFSAAGGSPKASIARWNGQSWSALGSGMNAAVHALVVHDDGLGGGPALYAGGIFTIAGGAPANRVARWDGSSWSALGTGLSGEVLALESFDDGAGSGPALFAGGVFQMASGQSRIARWDGQSWQAVGGGLGVEGRRVRTLAVFDDGEGPALIAGGTFTTSPGGDSYLARWGGCPTGPGSAYCFGDGSGSSCPCANPGAAGAGCGNSAGPGAVLFGGGSAGATEDDLLLRAHGLLPSQAALLFVGAQELNGGAGVAFGDGLRCAWGSVVRLGVRIPSEFGQATWGPNLGNSGGWQAGDVRRFQAWYRDPAPGSCSGFNLTNGLEVGFH